MAEQAEKNKAIVRRWLECIGTGDLTVYDELAAPDYGLRDTAGLGLKELKAMMASWPAARSRTRSPASSSGKPAGRYMQCSSSHSPIRFRRSYRRSIGPPRDRPWLVSGG